MPNWRWYEVFSTRDLTVNIAAILARQSEGRVVHLGRMLRSSLLISLQFANSAAVLAQLRAALISEVYLVTQYLMMLSNTVFPRNHAHLGPRTSSAHRPSLLDRFRPPDPNASFSVSMHALTDIADRAHLLFAPYEHGEIVCCYDFVLKKVCLHTRHYVDLDTLSDWITAAQP